MGCGASADLPKEYPVRIHVYRLMSDDGRQLVRDMMSQSEQAGFGVFHSGVEVNGKEYSYGRVEKEFDGDMRVRNAHQTGVWKQRPKVLPPSFAGATLKESIEAGVATMKPSELQALLARVSRDWRGIEYDRLRKNCNHFAAALCNELGVSPPPDYVNRMANTGAEMADAARGALGMLMGAGLGLLGGMLAEAGRHAQQQQRGRMQPVAPATGVPIVQGSQPVTGVPVATSSSGANDDRRIVVV